MGKSGKMEICGNFWKLQEYVSIKNGRLRGEKEKELCRRTGLRGEPCRKYVLFIQEGRMGKYESLERKILKF